MENVNNLNASVLSFVGDAVYGLMVREHLAKINRPSDKLHKLSVELVNANAQAKAYKLISQSLSESEQSVFKRGRNFHTNNTPKSSSSANYHTATGLECLFGYLYLSGEYERLKTLFEIIWEYAEF